MTDRPATGVARLLMAPDLVAHIVSLGERHRAAVLGIPETLERLRERAGITGPKSPAARAVDGGVVLGYLAAISDTLLALHFHIKEGGLPPTAEALRKLEAALNSSTVGVNLGIMSAAAKARQDPVEMLFKAFSRTIHGPKAKR